MKAEELFKAWKSEQYKDQSTEERMEFVEHLHTFPKYFEKTFLAGLKAGRPQWHDLQKDKNDLPKGYAENTRFLCSVKGETLFLVRYGSFWQGNFKVDAWCEIPTFDKE